jgi:hypothetical protein
LVDLSSLNKACNDIGAIDDPELRAKFIDDNSCLWSDLKYALWSLGSCKCWYSEATLQQQQGHVEHFRPKKRVASTQHSGYWWDAFDWNNLRLAHPTVNIRVTDYLTGQLAGKGTYFPLMDPTTRATDKSNEVHERPILLDPTIPEDCRLLCFESSSGRPIPTFSEAADPWNHQRARESIKYYHLDEGTWNFQRKDLMDEVGILCDKIIESFEVDQDLHEKLLAELMNYIHHLSEFSSAAYQIAREKNIIERLFPLPIA